MAAGRDELNSNDAQPDEYSSSQFNGLAEHRDSERSLLSSHEREICSRISEGNTIHSQRAMAILAIEAGATQTQAGQGSGLTRGQVRYWLEKFRDQGLDIFPQDILQEAHATVQTAVYEPELAEQLPEKKAEPSKKAEKKKASGKKKSKKSKKLTQKQKPKKKKNKPKERDKKKKNRKKKKK